MELSAKEKIKWSMVGLYFGSGVNPRFSPMLEPEDARNMFGDREFGDYGEYETYRPLYTLYDQHTMTKIVYDILLRYGEITPEIFRDYLMELHNKYDVFSGDVYGPSTQKAVKKILDGEDIYEMGKSGITCGAAMRALPVAMYFYNDLDALIKNTVGACIISHNTDVALDSAIACNVTLASLIQGKEKFEAIETSIETVKNNHGKHGVATDEPKIHDRLRLAVDSVNDSSLKEAMHIIPEKIGVSWFARETIPGAFANFIVTDTPKESALLSLRCGGDNQTVPEIACAFHGASWGKDIFPESVVEEIESVNDVDVYGMADTIAAKVCG